MSSSARKKFPANTAGQASSGTLFQRVGNRNHDETAKSLPRLRWALTAVGLLAVGCFMVHDRIKAAGGERHWRRFLLMSKGFDRLDEREQYEVIKSEAAELEAVLAQQPHHARAQCRLAGMRLFLFNGLPGGEASPMSARQVRDAALASRFDSPQALKDWLTRAFGNRVEHLQKARRHCRMALDECPLQAEAYLNLAQLCFLEQPCSPGKDAYIRQALKVRPHDAGVAFEAGNEALLDGDLEKACVYWQASFRAGSVYRNRLMKLLAARVDADFFLETFSLDAVALDLLGEHYHRAGRMDDYRLVLDRSAAAHAEEAAATRGREAAESWMKAAAAYDKLNEQGRRRACLSEAVRADAAGYDARYMLGACCYKQKDYEAACEHLRWCLRERPYDPGLRSLAESAFNKRLRLGSRRIGE